MSRKLTKKFTKTILPIQNQNTSEDGNFENITDQREKFSAVGWDLVKDSLQ